MEAKNAGVGRIVYTSTTMALGTRKGEMGTERTEHCGYNTSEYGRSKYLGLCEIQRLASESVPVVTTIPGGVFGPGGRKTLGPGILRLLDGRVPGLVYPEAVFSYTYIDDAVKGHILAAKNGKVGERYIISTGNYSTREMFDMVADIAGIPRVKKAIPPTVIGLLSNMQMLRASITKRPPEFPRDMVKGWKWGGIRVDNSRSISELGIRYTPMEQAVRETVEWYWANGLAPPASSRK